MAYSRKDNDIDQYREVVSDFAQLVANSLEKILPAMSRLAGGAVASAAKSGPSLFAQNNSGKAEIFAKNLDLLKECSADMKGVVEEINATEAADKPDQHTL